MRLGTVDPCDFLTFSDCWLIVASNVHEWLLIGVGDRKRNNFFVDYVLLSEFIQQPWPCLELAIITSVGSAHANNAIENWRESYLSFDGIPIEIDGVFSKTIQWDLVLRWVACEVGWPIGLFFYCVARLDICWWTRSAVYWENTTVAKICFQN